MLCGRLAPAVAEDVLIYGSGEKCLRKCIEPELAFCVYKLEFANVPLPPKESPSEVKAGTCYCGLVLVAC